VQAHVGSLPMSSSARWAGAAAWTEQALFEVLGGWAGSSSAPQVAVYFDSASQHHAWRAQLWLERLPARLTGASGPDLVRAPWGGAAEALRGLSELDGDVERLAAYCRVVLEWAVAGYRRWQRLCSPAADRPVLRVLSLVVGDSVADWQDGCSVLAEVMSLSEGGVAVAITAGAAASSARIEELLLREGPPHIA